MKSRVLNIVSSICLISALIFAQIGVNFFHNNHDAHQVKSISVPFKAGEAGIQKHGEHCKVCSIDFFNHAFVSSPIIFVDCLFFDSHKNQYCHSTKQIVVSYTQGRAPPVLS